MEAYAPVGSFTLVRTLFYLALFKGMFVAQVDAKTDFLNTDLNE